MKAIVDRSIAVEARPSQVELWLLNPGQIDALAPKALELLPHEEQGDALRQKNEALWRAWAGRQVALRLVLASYTGQKPERLLIFKDARGKPGLAGRSDLKFSVSACEGWWLGAFSDEEVGVDLECIRPGVDLDSVARLYFNENELAHLRATPDQKEKLRFFYRCWTRKEAFLKFQGLGLAGLPLLREAAHEPSAWMEDLDLDKELAACLVLQRPPDWIRRRSWSDHEIPGFSMPHNPLPNGLSAKEQPTCLETTMSEDSQYNEPLNAYSVSALGPQAIERLEKQAFLWLHMELPFILKTLPRAGRFVDLGCGSGIQADAIAGACPDAQVYGFDVDPLAVEQSRLHYGSRPGLHFDLRRIEQGPPPGFPLADVAMLRLVLMHNSHPQRALEAAKAWLKPGGILHVFEADDRFIKFEPTPEWIPDLLELMQAIQKHRGGDRQLGQQLPSMLTAAGWRVAGQRQFEPDPLVVVAAIPKVFLPVAEYYLNGAEQLDFVRPETISKVNQGLSRLKDGAFSFSSAHLPIFHAWAQNVHAAAE